MPARALVVSMVLLAVARAPAAPAKEPPPARGAASPLAAQIDRVSFRDTTLSDAIALVRDQAKLNIHVNWKAMTAAGVDESMKVNLQAKQISAGAVLTAVCAVAGGARLNWQFEGGIVNLSTKADLARQTSTAPYAPLLAGTGDRAAQRQQGVRLIEALLGPGGAPPAVAVQAGRLVVTAPPAGHDLLRRLYVLAQHGAAPEQWHRLVAARNRLRAAVLPRVALRDARFDDAVATVAEAAGVNVAIDVFSLAAAGVELGRKQELVLQDTTADRAVRLLIESVGAGAKVRLILDPIADGEVLLLTTAERAATHLLACDLTPALAQKLGAATVEQVPRAIRSKLGSSAWQPEGPGEVWVVGPRLVFLQTADDLVRIGQVLGIRAVATNPKPVRVSAPAAPAAATRPAAASRPAAAADAEAQANRMLRLADSYRRAGMTPKAVALWRKVVSEFPGTAAAGEASKLLEGVKPASRPAEVP